MNLHVGKWHRQQQDRLKLRSGFEPNRIPHMRGCTALRITLRFFWLPGISNYLEVVSLLLSPVKLCMCRSFMEITRVITAPVLEPRPSRIPKNPRPKIFIGNSFAHIVIACFYVTD